MTTPLKARLFTPFTARNVCTWPNHDTLIEAIDNHGEPHFLRFGVSAGQPLFLKCFPHDIAVGPDEVLAWRPAEQGDLTEGHPNVDLHVAARMVGRELAGVHDLLVRSFQDRQTGIWSNLIIKARVALIDHWLKTLSGALEKAEKAPKPAPKPALPSKIGAAREPILVEDEPIKFHSGKGALH